MLMAGQVHVPDA